MTDEHGGHAGSLVVGLANLPRRECAPASGRPLDFSPNRRESAVDLTGVSSVAERPAGDREFGLARGAGNRWRPNMSGTDMSSESAPGTPPVNPGEMRLEVVVVPVSNVDRAKSFYQGLGWRLDADLAVEDGYSVVQLTPPGSACSIIFGEGVTTAQPGSLEGLQ